MGTWVKETDKAIYLMEGGTYIASVVKQPSQSNPQEQVVDISALKSWFARSDNPRSMTFATGTGAPEPDPANPPTEPDGGGDLDIENTGQIRVVEDTYFKLSPKQSSELSDSEKVWVKKGTVFDIKHYTDVGGSHWQIELTEPILGDGSTTTWYVYWPHIRLLTNAVLTVTADTFFKLEPVLSSELSSAEKVFVKAGNSFKLASYMPAAGNHTHIELADTTLGPGNNKLWYVYNLHVKAEAGDSGNGGDGGDGGGSIVDHDGMQIEVLNDTYFKLSPKMSSELTDAQKVFVKKGEVFDIQYFTDVGSFHWLIELVKPSIGDSNITSWYIYTPDTKLVSDIVLTVDSDTFFKLEPKPSSELPDGSKEFVHQGEQFQLISYLPAADNHTRIELADPPPGIGDKTTWYVYTPHVTIEGQRQFLQTVSDTVFKVSNVQSSQLSPDEKVFVKNKTVFELNSYGQPEKNHLKVTLKGAYLSPENRNTWYCYVPDIAIKGTEPGNQPGDGGGGGGSTDPADRGIAMQFPGFSGTYYSNDPILWTTAYGERGHFTWGEALHADSSTGYYRHPTGAEVIYGILRVAPVMEDIRERYGGVPITVNSWYRDPATNAAVGGASQSRHMVGDAVDFVVPGIHPYDVYADLDDWWGSRGGLASSSVFTHIDVRGYFARWDYGLRGNSIGTWIKETDVAVYLMKGNAWISRITKLPSSTNPLEQVADITGMKAWFSQSDAPRAMTISLGTGAPEPEQWGDPNSTENINASGLEILKHFEGLRTTAYQDSVGVWTIGYGHTSMAGPPTVYQGMTITEAEAESILKQDLELFERGVSEALSIATSSDQFSAMVSFTFNVGIRAFQDSTLLRKHNGGDFPGAADEFLRWVYAGGEVLPGLQRRRQAERALYLSQDYSPYL